MIAPQFNMGFPEGVPSAPLTVAGGIGTPGRCGADAEDLRCGSPRVSSLTL